MQIPRQVITNVDSNEFKPGDTFYWDVFNDKTRNIELWKWAKKHFFGIREIYFHGIFGSPENQPLDTGIDVTHLASRGKKILFILNK